MWKSFLNWNIKSLLCFGVESLFLPFFLALVQSATSLQSACISLAQSISEATGRLQPPQHSLVLCPTMPELIFPTKPDWFFLDLPKLVESFHPLDLLFSFFSKLEWIRKIWDKNGQGKLVRRPSSKSIKSSELELNWERKSWEKW